MFYSYFSKRRRIKREKKRRNKNEILATRIPEMAIWYVESPAWQTPLQKNRFQSDEGSWSYKGVKIASSFFLSIYSQCGTPAYWAARHTTVGWSTWQAPLQRNWFQLDEGSRSYKGVKIALSFFLSMYSQSGVPASRAA